MNKRTTRRTSARKAVGRTVSRTVAVRKIQVRVVQFYEFFDDYDDYSAKYNGSEIFNIIQSGEGEYRICTDDGHEYVVDADSLIEIG